MSMVDVLLIGGGMANTFLKAEGYEIGDSLYEAEKVDVARALIAKASQRNLALLLPDGCGHRRSLRRRRGSQNSGIEQAVPQGWRILDIGPGTIAEFQQLLADAQTIIWNGTLGVAEMPAFAKGTDAIIKILAELTQAGRDHDHRRRRLGGGSGAGWSCPTMSHVSTGGGASLEFLEGRVLPGVAALQDK